MKHILFCFFTLCLILNKCFSQSYFQVETTFPCNGCGPYSKNLSDLHQYTYEQVQNFFNYISHNSGIEFRYPQGGCQQRAQIMHKLLDSMKIDHARAWLFAPIDLVANDKTQLEIADKNHLVEGGTIKWNYHVAPCVIISQNNKIDTLIIDPSLDMNKPLTLSQWLSSITNSDKSKYTFLDSQYYFFNTQNNGSSSVLNGFFYTYAPVANSTTMYDNATVERELAVNDVALFLKQKLDSGYQDPQNEIKSLLGNVENMISFFASQQRCNSLKNVSVRTLLTKHSNLMEQALSYYNNRVQFWLSR